MSVAIIHEAGGHSNDYSRPHQQHLSAWDDVPAQYRVPAQVELRVNLIGGELRRIEGATEEVFSPVCVDSATGLQRYRSAAFR